MLKGGASIIRRIYVYTFHCSDKVFLECAKCKKIVAMNEHIARPWFPSGESPGFDFPKTVFRGVNEQTRFNGKRFVFLANPCKLQFIYLVQCHHIL